MAKRPCARPGCQAVVVSGYCDGCRPKSSVSVLHEQRRGSSTKRGYDAVWQRFRAWYLKQPENILCADCKVRASTDVHHIVKLAERPDLRLVASNCMGLCGGCHKARTARGE